MRVVCFSNAKVVRVILRAAGSSCTGNTVGMTGARLRMNWKFWH